MTRFCDQGKMNDRFLVYMCYRACSGCLCYGANTRGNPPSNRLRVENGRKKCLRHSAFVEGAPWRRIACIDPIADIVDFARRMDTQFSSNPSCHGMELVRFPWGPISTDKAVEILKRPHWLFFIFAYAPGDAKQVWKREDPSKKSVFGGEGSPKQIVEDVCAVVNDRGGIISRTR